MRAVSRLAKLLVCTGCIGALVSTAHAQTRELTVPAGDLAVGLQEFIRQSGSRLLYRSVQLEGVSTEGVNGRFSPDEAIEQLLRGTGFTVEKDASGVFVIIPRPTTAAKPLLQRVAVATQTAATVAPAAEPVDQVAEVIVTARRTAESMQTTPVAVTALDSAAIERAQISDLRDIQRAAPNLSISSKGPGSSAVSFISIRGQSNLSGTLGNDPSIGVYVDGVYIGRPGGSLLDMIDMERLEVLRGPQGTLFGRNTTGGALNITTHQPTDTFEGSVAARLGNYDLREITGVVNLPMSDQFAARLVYQHSERSGYGRSHFTGTDRDDRDNDFLRASLRYQAPSGNWDFTLAADRTDRADSGQLVVLTAWNPTSPLLTTPNNIVQRNPPDENAPGPQDDTLSQYVRNANGYRGNYASEAEFQNYLTEGVSGTLNIDLGWAQFKSITAWRSLKATGVNDSDATPYRLLRTQLWNDGDQVSQELQLTGSAGPLSWTTGLFYFEEEPTEITNTILYPQTTPQGVETTQENNASATNTSYAAFVQLYYQLNTRLRLAGGVRYTQDEREIVRRNLSTIDPAPGVDNCLVPIPERDPGVPGCSGTLSTDFNYVSYLVGMDYQLTDDIFLYAKTSRAHLAGGFNGRPRAIPTFDPESVRDFEIGAKADWLNRRLRTNIAIFYAEQDDVQRTVSAVDTTGRITQFIQNAGTAHVQGIEFEGTVLPWQGMELSASVGWMDAEYDRFTETIDANPATPVIEPLVIDRSGETPPQAPKSSYRLAATQRLSSSYGTYFVHADYSFISRQAYGQSTPAPNAPTAAREAIERSNELNNMPGYGLLNAQVSLELDEPNLTLAVWGRNLAAKEYLTLPFADLYSSLGFAFAYPGDPRTYGLSATFRF